jgi:phosphopantothenoylcysteine decarboxylase/phosphopantothenate--cysteine ligase
MSTLSNRNIILGISGGIAAYKAAELTRRLRDQNANVRVVMTKGAMEFITPLTLQAVSGEPVHHSLLDPEAEAAMGHIELARWADAILIAPGSANLLSRLASGQADDLLTTLCLASNAPLLLAPAMNQAMWAKQSTQDNIALLSERGAAILGPDSGAQACGDVGPGRMLDVPDLVSALAASFESRALDGKHVVITAGPTREAIDPVRYLSNHSSGKMGFALARAAYEAGAKTTLIAGPVALSCEEGINRINVESAADMLEATLANVDGSDIFIATAAVADYTPVDQAAHKIKKSQESLSIELKRTTDILATVSALPERPFCVGFAAETNDVLSYARGKLEKKKLDMVVANDVSRSDIGFQSDSNQVTVVTAGGEQELPLASKQRVAQQLIAIIGENSK